MIIRVSLRGTLVLPQLICLERLHYCCAFPRGTPSKGQPATLGGSSPIRSFSDLIGCRIKSRSPGLSPPLTLPAVILHAARSSWKTPIHPSGPGSQHLLLEDVTPSSGVSLLSSLQTSLGLTCLSSLFSASSTFLAHIRHLLNLYVIKKFRR